MGAAASIAIALHATCSAAAAVCPAVGLAAGVFGAGVAIGAAAAVCPPVGLAAVFGAGAVLGAAFRVKATHAVATDFDALDAVTSAASEAATSRLRVVRNAACSAFEGAKRLVRSACRGAKKEVGTGAERCSAKNQEEEAAAAKRERGEMDMDHRAAQHARAGNDIWTVVSEAASFDVAAGNAPWDSAAAFPAGASGARGSVDPSASQLLATRAAWRASEVMAALETLKPLEEKLGANIPREAKSCICVMAAAAGVCLDVFKPPPTPSGGPVWDSGLRCSSVAVVP